MLVCVTPADVKQIWNTLGSLEPFVPSSSHTCTSRFRGGCIDNSKLVMRTINDAKENFIWEKYAGVFPKGKKGKKIKTAVSWCRVWFFRVLAALVQLLARTTCNYH